MKFKIFCTLIAIAGLINNICYAQEISTLSTLSVSGTGTLKAKPDVVNLSFGVTSKGKTANEATRQNAINAQKLIDALIRAGITDKDIQTSNLNVNPIYKRTPQFDDVENTIIGYEATNYLNVTVHKVQDAGNIIDIAVSTGDYSINNISFSIDKRDPFKEEALRKAVADARLTAEIVASAANKTISGIKNITVNASNTIFPAFAGFAANEKDVSTPVLPGDLTVTETVSVEFILNK